MYQIKKGFVSKIRYTVWMIEKHLCSCHWLSFALGSTRPFVKIIWEFCIHTKNSWSLQKPKKDANESFLEVNTHK